MRKTLILELLPGSFGICRLDAQSPVPRWASGGELSAVVRTPEALTVICPDDRIPENARCERSQRCLKAAGPLAFSETGVLESLARPLADARIPIFAVSTFDTDYLLIPGAMLKGALAVLRGAGHRICERSSDK